MNETWENAAKKTKGLRKIILYKEILPEFEENK